MPIQLIPLRQPLRYRVWLSSGAALVILGLAGAWLFWTGRETWAEPWAIIVGASIPFVLAAGVSFFWDVLRALCQNFGNRYLVFIWNRPPVKAGAIASLSVFLIAIGLFALRESDRPIAFISFGSALLPVLFVYRALGGRLSYGRWGYLVMALASLGFVIAGWGVLLVPNEEYEGVKGYEVGWLVIGFFLPAALFFFARTVSPRFLLRWRDMEVTSHGLTLTRANGEVVIIPWAEISDVGRWNRGDFDCLGFVFVNFEEANRVYRLSSPAMTRLLIRVRRNPKLRLLLAPYEFSLPFHQIYALRKDPKALADEAIYFGHWRKKFHVEAQASPSSPELPP